ncbi:MAG: phosphoethanolamine transferase [Ostreibacterium sp.]
MMRKPFLTIADVSVNKLIMISSLLFLLFYNFTFFHHVLNVYPLNGKNAGFLISLVLLLFLVNALGLSLLCYRLTVKPVLIILFIVSAVVAYFMDTYDVIIDDSMLQNAMSTDYAETADLLSIKLLIYVFLLGVLPPILVFKAKLKKQTLLTSVRSKFLIIFLLLLGIVAVVWPFGNYYASFIREHKIVRYYTNPIYYLDSTYKFIRGKTAEKNIVLKKIGEDATISKTNKDRKLVIFVLGETGRSDHFSLNGYKRNTNPLLSKEKNLISFPDFWSSGTSTAYSLPCMFSNVDTNDCNQKIERRRENLLDVLNYTHQVHILWRDNNSDSKGVALRVQYEDFKTSKNNPLCEGKECRDIGMLSGLQDYINQQKTGSVFIVLHQMGSHGPAYYKRYPKKFEKFTPVCRTNQLNSCSKEEINNAYDNSVLYTDYFISKVIKLLKINSQEFKTAMLYMSDHGESLGEDGIYLHGMPYFLAPKEQKHIPGLFWFGDGMEKMIDSDKLREKSTQRFSHDNLFYVILGLFNLKTKAYNKDMDFIDYHD